MKYNCISILKSDIGYIGMISFESYKYKDGKLFLFDSNGYPISLLHAKVENSEDSIVISLDV